MIIHYLLQSLFAIVGLVCTLASLCNWDWFFVVQSKHGITHKLERKKARIIFGLIGLLMMAATIYFFSEIAAMQATRQPS